LGKRPSVFLKARADNARKKEQTITFVPIKKQLDRMMEFPFDINQVNEIAVLAGKAIMKIYGTAFEQSIQHKSDDSPLTKADLESHRVITRGLKKIADYPVFSEEERIPDYAVRKSIPRYWLVDPLDGTKEFIKRNGEFTVNIALIEEGRSVLGSVYVPVLDELYWAIKGEGAFVKREGKVKSLRASRFEMDQKGLRVVTSRSFLNAETRDYLARFNEPKLMPRGSSLKLLMLAEGEADFYPRLGPTMEWDIAAAQIVLEEAGGQVLQVDKDQVLHYNKENLLNPYFLAMGIRERK
jgi:3'(2'), 5'-bisphosphate nucleotidase